MRDLTRTLAVCLGLVLAAFGALAAPPVDAQQAGAATGRAFSIQPEAGQPAGETGSGYFSLVANPGQSREARIVVKNVGTEPVVLRADPVDGVQVKAGGVAYSIVGAPVTGAGAWLTVLPAKLNLAPGQTQLVTATLRTPDGTAPGEYVGGVSVQDEQVQGQSTGTSFLIDVHYRQVLAVVAAVPGTQTPAMEIGAVTLSPVAKGSRAVVELKNSGNVRLKGTGTFEIGNGQGGSGVIPFTVGTLLPGATSAAPVELPTVAVQPGIYDVRVRVASDTSKPLASWDGKVTVSLPAAPTKVTQAEPTLLAPTERLIAANPGFPFLPVGLGLGIVIVGLGVVVGLRLVRRGAPVVSPPAAIMDQGMDQRLNQRGNARSGRQTGRETSQPEDERRAG